MMGWRINLLTIGVVINLIVLLWCINLPRRLRHHQYWSPVSTLIGAVTLCVIYYYFYPLFETFPKMVLDRLAGWSIPISDRTEQIVGNGYLLLNLLILHLFLFFKLWFHTLVMIPIGIRRVWAWLRRKLGGMDAAHRLFAERKPKARFAYENRASGIFLKKIWVFPAVYMHWVGVPAVLFFLAMCLYYLNAMAEPVPNYLPRLPVLALLIILEAAWYLGGLRWEDDERQFSVDETPSRLLGACSELMSLYHSRWPQQIMASAVLPPGRAPIGSGNELIVRDAELDQIKKNLAQLGINLRVRQIEALRQMWDGQDLLLTSYRTDEIAPCMFACLQRVLEEGCRVIMLVDTRRRSEHLHKDVRQWVEQWMAKPIFAGRSCRIASVDQFLRNEEILITSVGELLDLGINNFKEWFGRVRTIVVLNVAEVVFPDILSANALFQIICDQSRHDIQKIMLATDKRKNMEDAARGYLTAKPVESDFFDAMMPTEEACYTVWRSEGREPFQQRIGLGGESNMGVEMALATPALKDGVRPIHLAGLDELPWKEYLESLDNMQFRVGLSVNLKETLCYHTRPYIQQVQNRTFYIVRDNTFNLLVTLEKYLALGAKGAFVNVICPPYLLRDYFVDNMDFFMGTEPLRSLAPLLTHNRTTILYYLIERLIANELTEEQIRHHLEWGLEEETNRGAAIETLLDDLFKAVLGLSLKQTGYLKANTQWRFDLHINAFEKIMTYQLSPEIKRHLTSFIGDYYRIYFEKEGIVDTISANHFHQKYQSEQIHAFMGQPAEIKKISPHTRSVFTEHRAPEGDVIYRPIDTVQVLKATPSFVLPDATKGDFTLVRKFFEVDLSFRTEAFLTFRFGMDFNEGCELKRLDPRESPDRHHSHGRMLVVAVCRTDNGDRIENAPEISNTLALLMNELLVTLFPETHVYIKVTTPHGRADDSSPVGQLIPGMISVEGNDGHEPEPHQPNGVCLYVLEDSQKDMGLVRSVKENLSYIFEILEDYLSWYLEAQQSDTPHLNFGMDAPPNWLALEPSLRLIEALLKGHPNTLRKRRHYFADSDKSTQLDTSSERLCDFCGESLSDSIYEQLEDGRERCHMCRDHAVEGQQGYERLLDEGLRWLLNTHSANISKNIRIKVTSAETIHNMIDKTFVPTASFDPRAVGLAVSDRDGYAVYMENGHRFDLTLATLVHELTHIWQYENLNYAKMKREYGRLLTEGHAVHAAISCMQSKGLAQNFCESEPLRSDEYGQGFQLIQKLLRERGSRNPFAMLKEMYPC